MESRPITSQSKEQGQYPAILAKEAWWIKDLLNGFWGIFPVGYSGQSRWGQDVAILSARVANHSVHGASHIINLPTYLQVFPFAHVLMTFMYNKLPSNDI